MPTRGREGTGFSPSRRGKCASGTVAFAKDAASPGGPPQFRVKTLGLGELLYPDAAGGGLAQMHRLSVHAQGHGLVVLALQHVDSRCRTQV